MEGNDHVFLAAEVFGGLPGRRVVFPFNLIVKPVLIVAIEDFFEFPSFSFLVCFVIPFKDSALVPA